MTDTPVRGFYGRWARLYDLLATLPGVGSWRRQTVAALALDPDDTVVEMGCGTGANVPYLRQRVSHGRIVGVDLGGAAGGEHGEFRSFRDYVEMIDAIGRVPVERSTDYRQRRRIDPAADPVGPTLGPKADGTPLLAE